jgi:hypothetical protein
VSTFNRSNNNNNNPTVSRNVPQPNYNNDSNYNNNAATYRNPTKPNYNFSLNHRESNYDKICNFCKFKGHTYKECRKRRYFKTQNNSGNAKDPSSNKDATRADPESHSRPMRLIDQTKPKSKQNRNLKSEEISRCTNNQY